MFKFILWLILIQSTVQKTLVVMDFDHTIVEKNIIQLLTDMLPKDKLPVETKESFLKTFSFIPHTQLFFKKVHELKVTEQKMLQLIENQPPIDEMDKVLRILHHQNCDIVIISNSYSVFVESWLRFRSLRHMVNRIFTNPAWFDSTGLLHVKGYHFQSKCRLSPSNLCKRSVMEFFLKYQRFQGISYNKIIYIGDGKNDMCAALSLKENDLLFPRVGFLLHSMLSNITRRIKPKIFPWTNGSNIINILQTNKL
ncbi:pyridoxal phosphate phosphatase PHOSPHO2-like [Lycorma delicatula]|uniref:pyridoxal phosphate phosphatase PHOSPHO2-like n=1 Tax=Lycorma delicatula TaxID=130591 RepID=UPI003F50DC10